LANAQPQWRDRILAGPHERYTPATVTDPRALTLELERVRTEGYATTDEEFEEGLSAAAAPVYAADGEVIAAIGISGPSYRLDARALRELAPVVREAGQRASIGSGHTQRDDGDRF